MSSDPNVDEKVKENFRKRAMLEGVIRFSPKSDLVDKHKVSPTTHTSEKTYSGKGPQKRANESANRVAKENNDPVKKVEWKPSKNTREAFKAEDKRIEKNGGAGNTEKNYNKVNSPGKKYNEQDKQ